jgi:hypothetical protein
MPEAGCWAGAERIGDFLIRIGAMSRDQVADVLRAKKAGDSRLLGEIALELGYIGDDAIKRYVEYLEKQQKQD